MHYVSEDSGDFEQYHGGRLGTPTRLRDSDSLSIIGFVAASPLIGGSIAVNESNPVLICELLVSDQKRQALALLE